MRSILASGALVVRMTPKAVIFMLTALAFLAPARTLAENGVALDVPFVPTPQTVVDRMLELAGVDAHDVVYDLGSGDGRIVIAAARKYGASGIEIDLDPARIGEANGNARRAGVQDKVRFVVGDLFVTDLTGASVVTLYLGDNINRQLRPQLWKQLKVGTRVVSHQFSMGPEWPPQKTEKVGGRMIYFWTISEANKNAVR